MSLWILSQTEAHQFGHSCSHDPNILEKIMPQEYYDSIEDRSKRRVLETGSAQPFRVTTEYSYLDDPKNGQVIPRSTPIKKRGDTTCYDINVPTYLQSSGDGQKNSDLHILVTFENSPSSSNLANAVACDYDPGPIVGRIKFNIGTMKNIGTTAQAFESDFSTAIHEITHILGFSSGAMQYWIDPDTNKPYGTNLSKIQVKEVVRGINDVIKLKSKNVLETARRYYNCPTLDSLPMENQGGSGSFGSHWERDLIQNEYMTASSVLGHAVISEFTASLLMDTGFYAEINTNMVEQTYWGKGKGCDFITYSCDNKNQMYSEFQYSDNQNLCDYYSLGQGYASTNPQDPFSQCKQIQNYSNGFCFDEQSQKPDQTLRNNPGQTSKCFFSTSIQINYTTNPENGIRCHKYQCLQDNTQINVILWQDKQVTCKTPDQTIDLSTQSIDTKGNLKCPSNFNLFCNFPKFCSNFCNGNGICSNAVCYCLDGFAGEDCSKSCGPSEVWDGTQCTTVCPDNSFLNPDNTCKQTCPKAYYKNSDQKTCNLCHKTCSNCTGPLNSQCSECNSGYFLQGTTCQVQLICDTTCLTCSGLSKNECLTCIEGRFLDSSKQCQNCQTPCSKCVDLSTKCSDCIIDYNFNSANNSCSPICDQSCLTCSSPKDSNKCLSCNDGFFLLSGKCIQCQMPCSSCIDTSNKCLKCVGNYKLDSTNCIPICDSTCQTCSKPYDSNSCTSCNDGFFLDGTRCKSCSSPCQKCDTLSTKCLSCTSNYSYDSSNFKCNPNCHISCKSCSLPNDMNSCLSCYEGAFLNGSQCQQCTSPCKTCDQQSNRCQSCSENYSLDNYAKICNPNCDASCKTCKNPIDPNSCLSCNGGFYIVGSKCLECSSPCKTCISSSQKCLSCITNYDYVVDQNKCIGTCDTSCKTCSNPNDPDSCLSCYDGFILFGGKCKNCEQPCKTCSGTPKSCLSCFEGKFLTGNECSNCDTNCNTCVDNSQNCLSCKPDFKLNEEQKSCYLRCDQSCKTCSEPNNPNKCLSCPDGYFLFQNSCKMCQQPCQNCLGEKQCLSCISSDYYYDENNHNCKIKCHPDCKSCSGPTQYNCTDCFDSYYLDNNSCKKCLSPCNNCNTSKETCTSCVNGYNLEGNKCIIQCDSSCKTCNTPSDSKGCSSCKDGFYLDQGTCKNCQYPCQNCKESATKCIDCVLNYRLEFNQCNPICDTSCKTCLKPIDTKSCLSCFEGFYLQNSECLKCQSPCETCIQNASKCLTCQSGYKLSQKNPNSCEPTCDTSCLICSSNGCSSCKDGFYLEQGTCKNCQYPCQNCQESATKCIDCVLNYRLEYNQCNPICDTSCKTCLKPIDTKSCLSCFEGFYLQNSECLKCQSPCETCIQNASKCLTCQSGYKISFNNPNSCEPTCDSSCLTCSQLQNPKACLTCYDGKYLDSNQCKNCSENCAECNDSYKCQRCQPNYQLNEKTNKCEYICDQSCMTCSLPKNPKACLSCVHQKVLLNGSCQECPSGSYIDTDKCSKCPDNCKVCTDSNSCKECDNDYSLDDNKSCKQNHKNLQCHYSCNTCLGPSHSDCKSCAGDRILHIKYIDPKTSQEIRVCECPQEQSDFNQPGCDKSKIQSSLKVTTTAFFISSGSSTALLSIASANPLVIGGLFDFCQTASFFTYINEKPALGFDNVAQNLYISHITKIFDFSKLSQKNKARLLQEDSQQSELSPYPNNSKIILNDKYPEFFVNALSILILICLTWLFSGLSLLINHYKKNQFSSKIKKIFCISFPLCIFVLTSQELSLLVFFQFQQLSLENKSNRASAFLSFIALFYVLGILAYLFFKLNYKQVLVKQVQNVSSQLEYENQAQPVLDTETYQIKFLQNSTNNEQLTFYIIYLFIRQNNFLNRAFVQILVIKKIITSLIMTFGYQNPITQVSLLLVLYIFYWLYIILSKPFIQINHTRVYIFIETISLTMCILYLILLNDSSNNEKQKIISLVMLVLINIALVFYFLVSLVYIVQLAIQCYKKYKSKNIDVDALSHIELEQRDSLYDRVFADKNKSQNQHFQLDYNPNSYIKKQSQNSQEQYRSNLKNTFSKQQKNQPQLNSQTQINQDSINHEGTNNNILDDNMQHNLYNTNTTGIQQQTRKNKIYRLEYYRYYIPNRSQQIKSFGGGIF